jgi:hypothetical protein
MSDNAMRKFIEENRTTLSTILVPTNKDYGLSPTRGNVVDYNNVDIILPGSQIYPDRPIYQPTAAVTIRNKVLRALADIFPDYAVDDKGKEGTIITTDQAVQLVELIKTESTTSWQDKHMRNYLEFLEGNYGSNVRLRYREAPNRANRHNGVLPSGMISGADQETARGLDMPTLWIFLVKGSKPALGWANVDFVYPTLVVPNQPESLYGNIS